jgi:hypothetical protein
MRILVKGMPTMSNRPQVRTVVLWITAAVLGCAAGLQTRSQFLSVPEAGGSEAANMGFASRNDFLQMSALLDNGPIKSLDSRSLELLNHYVQVDGPPRSFVSAALTNISTSEAAAAAIGVAKQLHDRFGASSGAEQVIQEWGKNGLEGPAKELDLYCSSNVQTFKQTH